VRSSVSTRPLPGGGAAPMRAGNLDRIPYRYRCRPKMLDFQFGAQPVAMGKPHIAMLQKMTAKHRSMELR
jgi:hypothetical protein